MPHKPGHNGNGRNGNGAPRRMMGSRRAPSSAAGRTVTGGTRYLISTGSGTDTKHYSCPTPNGITTACKDVTNEVNVHATLTGRTELPHNRNSRVMRGGMNQRPARTANPNGRGRRTTVRGMNRRPMRSRRSNSGY